MSSRGCWVSSLDWSWMVDEGWLALCCSFRLPDKSAGCWTSAGWSRLLVSGCLADAREEFSSTGWSSCMEFCVTVEYSCLPVCWEKSSKSSSVCVGLIECDRGLDSPVDIIGGISLLYWSLCISIEDPVCVLVSTRSKPGVLSRFRFCMSGADSVGVWVSWLVLSTTRVFEAWSLDEGVTSVVRGWGVAYDPPLDCVCLVMTLCAVLVADFREKTDSDNESSLRPSKIGGFVHSETKML